MRLYAFNFELYTALLSSSGKDRFALKLNFSFGKACFVNFCDISVISLYTCLFGFVFMSYYL